MQEMNIIVNNEYLNTNFDLLRKLFPVEEPIIFIGENENMYDLLVMLGAFSSKSEVRKNWTRTGKEIPSGYNEFKNIGKQKKALYIWNPIEGDD